MHADEVMAFLSFLAVLVLVSYFIYLRHKRVVLRHTERLAALEKGVALPDLEEPSKGAPWSPKAYLLRGMLWLFSGLGLAAALLSLSLATRHEPGVRERIYESQRMRRQGVSEDQVQLYLKANEHTGMPAGVAGLALIPIGVGLAYILFYRREHRDVG